MIIRENDLTNEYYAWNRNGKNPKLELVRQNYVFCRNEKEMILSKTEYAEENSFCEVKRSLIFCRLFVGDRYLKRNVLATSKRCW